MGELAIRLKCIEYNEGVLVDKVCSEAQKRAYHKKEKFVNSTYRRMFLDSLSKYCDYEYDPETNKYRVLEVYKYPKTLYEAKIYKGI